VTRLLSLLRAPATALAVIAFTGAWTAVGAWAPWMRAGAVAPAWAAAVGLDHPFTAWPFLAAVALLFASTLACTWGKRRRILALRRGELPPWAVTLPARDADVRSFLAGQGFRGEGDVLVRHPLGLWGGLLLHVGLLVLIAAVFVQRGFADGGAFDLTAGEAARLDEPGVVFGRDRGPFAREALPGIEVRLLSFEPFLRQPGYAPDRSSRLWIAVGGDPPRVEALDRAAGVRAGSTEIFQAIPTGLSLTIQVPGMGLRAVRLQPETPRRSAASVADPAGAPVRFVVETERDVGDPSGTGRALAWQERDGERTAITAGGTFRFGPVESRAIGISRWGRFTWTRTPGLGAVVAGFLLVLAGSLLLLFPAGVARLPRAGEEGAVRVIVLRGGDALAADWQRAGSTNDGGAAP
jgi:hypothetical protein